MTGIHFALSVLAVVFGLGACIAQTSSSAADAAAPLVASVQVEPQGDSVHFVLQVTNASEQPVALEFTSGQSYDFVVHRGERELWRWSEGQFFTQALRSETLPPGETLRYQASWAPLPDTAGELTVTGRLVAQPHGVAQSARFRLP